MLAKEKNHHKTLAKKNKIFICIALGVIILSGACFYQVRQNKQKETEFQLGYAAGLVYRQTEGYKSACADYDVTLQMYPRRFKEKYHSEIQKIADTAKKYDYTLDDLFDVLEKNADLKNKMIDSVKQELDNMRKQIILAALQEKESNETLSWNDSYDGLLTLQGLCLDIDEHAEDYLNIYQDTSHSKLKSILDEL